jgi:PAS domain S-box-containing protein
MLARQLPPSAYRSVFENSMDAVFLTRPDGRIVAANPAACAMFGMTEAELCAVGRDGIRDAADLNWAAFLEERQKAGKARGELRYKRKDGSTFVGDASSVILEDGQSSFVIIRDITAMKAAEQALRESEYRVRHKLKTVLTPDGDIGVLKLADILDPTEIQSLMEEFFQLTQIPMAIIDLEGEVLVGVGWRDVCTKFHRVHPETYRNCIESDVQLSSGVVEGEYKLYKCRNNMWDVATPLVVAGRHVGNIFMGQFFFEDEPLDRELFRSQARRYGFDEGKYLAALEAVPRFTREALTCGMRFFQKFAMLISRLSYSNLQLARTMAERERAEEALWEAKAAAEEASQAKSEFLANMSHEIRTPMTVFLAAIEYLLQIDRDPEHRQLLGMADQSARRLRSLIDDILDFSQIEARKVNIEEEPFDLRVCVSEAVNMFALSAREKNLRLHLEVAPGTPERIIGDRDRLGQVLLNLIGNAVKFTHEGEISICVQPHDDLLKFSVLDTGIGISEEKCDILFESFSQADGSFTRQYGGTGLGLAISKGLVELMGGEIAVQSREGKGSVFTFTLPLKTTQKPISAPTETPPRDPGEKLSARILLAEDEPMIREMITMMLAQHGWEVESAESGKEAVEKWEKGGFDLILMDLQMPGMSGIEATQTIREREVEENRTCIIGLTAHARRDIKDDCLKAGMDRVLTKPVQMKDLYSAVGDCLQ